MNELYFNLIKKYPRNTFRIVMGFLLLGAVAFFIIKQGDSFTGTHLTIFTLAGVYYLLMGFGINPITFWGKAYIKINNKDIEIKPSLFAKATTLDWDTIKEVQIKVTGIRFLFKDATAHELDYQKLDDKSVSELKQALISICKEKNIALA